MAKVLNWPAFAAVATMFAFGAERSALAGAVTAMASRATARTAESFLSTQTQPIALGDVVRYLADVAGDPAAAGESFDVGGPDILTYRQMIERIARIRGRRRPILEVPVLTPRLSSYWRHLVTPVRAGVARPLIEGLRNPTVARDTRIRDLFPFALTGFDDAARGALALPRKNAAPH